MSVRTGYALVLSRLVLSRLVLSSLVLSRLVSSLLFHLLFSLSFSVFFLCLRVVCVGVVWRAVLLCGMCVWR